MPIVNGAAKDAARRSMRGCTGITATGRSSARSSMRRKRRFERPRKNRRAWGRHPGPTEALRRAFRR